MTQSMPTQESQHMSKGTSTSTPQPPPSDPTPSSTTIPTPMETEQGSDYNPSDYMSVPLLLSRWPKDDKEIEHRRKLMNEKLAYFERRNYKVLRKLWLGMQDAPVKMWPPIYVMKADIENKFI